MIFWLYSYFTGLVTIIMLAVCIGAALYLLTELTEEFPTMTGKIMNYLFVAITIMQVILWLDGLPTIESLIQLGSLACNYLMLKDFPFVELISFPTITSMILFVVTNIAWLRYFIMNAYGIIAIIGFFITNVWTMPCALFISLSINDFTLPGLVGSQTSRDNGTGRRETVFHSLLNFAWTHMSVIGGALNPLKLIQEKRK